ncbi:MAG: LacI family DNA-binding transcriptional regulator [Tessaracoccus sp.]|uniref:LacI family DNA-binding transcriptional regulator n=1 Tax=Tessaracoccus sp. TaxID=1971211 RepID=UPI001EB9B033|nr:LacI family DNA-binding transcriptional regulator [Tessaracoccus sp.]MBK7821025.1 LacI family DNA-binding transcriptional regulator [Tessaracoccus sp.]
MNVAGATGGRRPAVTLHDVAKAAGVSVATASHVANGRTDVRMSDKTRQRVQATIDELGYRSNALAKHLVKGSSQFIGLVADAIATTPFAGQIISGAQDEAWRHGFVLLVANTDSDTAVETEAIEMMLDHRVRGILYSTWFHRRVTVPSGLPIADTVLVNCYSDDDTVRSVVPDEVQGGRAATEMLLAQGHRRIAMVNTVTESPARVGRLQGYRQALEAYDVPFDPTLVIDAVSDQEGGYDAYDRIRESGASAVFCHNDRVAMGLYDAVRVRGLKIPGDLAVVGFDNQEVISAHLRPPLSTVQLPHYELGAAGVRVLLGHEKLAAGATMRLDCPVVARDSVRAVTP